MTLTLTQPSPLSVGNKNNNSNNNICDDNSSRLVIEVSHKYPDRWATSSANSSQQQGQNGYVVPELTYTLVSFCRGEGGLIHFRKSIDKPCTIVMSAEQTAKATKVIAVQYCSCDQ